MLVLYLNACQKTCLEPEFKAIDNSLDVSSLEIIVDKIEEIGEMVGSVWLGKMFPFFLSCVTHVLIYPAFNPPPFSSPQRGTEEGCSRVPAQYQPLRVALQRYTADPIHVGVTDPFKQYCRDVNTLRRLDTNKKFTTSIGDCLK
jgi:hypothetical protein